MRKILYLPGTILLVAFLLLSLTVLSGCGDEGSGSTTATTTGGSATTPTGQQQKGIALDPNLKSKTGTPKPDEMKSLIDLQAKVPYPVMVPTSLPAGYALQADLTNSSTPVAGRDPVGSYTFRYADESDVYKILIFNQSRSNAKPLSAYYLTRTPINGTEFLVYWHVSRDYLPQGDPIEMEEVGDAEAFVVVWKGDFKDASGQPQELWYQLSTGSHHNITWEEVRSILESMKPLGSVGE